MLQNLTWPRRVRHWNRALVPILLTSMLCLQRWAQSQFQTFLRVLKGYTVRFCGETIHIQKCCVLETGYSQSDTYQSHKWCQSAIHIPHFHTKVGRVYFVPNRIKRCRQLTATVLFDLFKHEVHKTNGRLALDGTSYLCTVRRVLSGLNDWKTTKFKVLQKWRRIVLHRFEVTFPVWSQNVNGTHIETDRLQRFVNVPIVIGFDLIKDRTDIFSIFGSFLMEPIRPISHEIVHGPHRFGTASLKEIHGLFIAIEHRVVQSLAVDQLIVSLLIVVAHHGNGGRYHVARYLRTAFGNLESIERATTECTKSVEIIHPILGDLPITDSVRHEHGLRHRLQFSSLHR